MIFDEKYKDITNAIAVGLFSVAWVFLIGFTITRIEKYDPNTLMRVFTVIVATGGVYVAIWKLAAENRWNQAEIYLEQAKELFEKAYSTLNQPGKDYTPDNNRRNWITCVRLLRAAEELAGNIYVTAHRNVYKEIRQYWRSQFYSLLYQDDESFPENYFAESPETFLTWTPNNRDPINEHSLTYLYKFVKWSDDMEDRLQNVEVFTDDEIDRMSNIGPKHMANLIKKVRRLYRNS